MTISREKFGLVDKFFNRYNTFRVLDTVNSKFDWCRERFLELFYPHSFLYESEGQ